MSYDIAYCEILKKDTNEFIYKTKLNSQTQKTNLWLPKDGGGRLNQEFGVKIYTKLHINLIINKDLLYSPENYTEYLIITYNGRDCKKEYIHIYVYIRITEALHCVPETKAL